MNKNEHLLELFKKINKKLMREIREQTKPLNLTRGELPVLVKLLKEGDGLTQKNLKEKLLISKSTLSKTIDRLEKKNYIRKKKKPEDKRATLIYLTQESEEIKESLKEINTEIEKAISKGFSKNEKKELIGYLNRLNSNLEDNNPNQDIKRD
ncbi:MAG: Transcriptional regulator, MarR family [Candidatus Methanohalarchaeum thermophilum]|uniref:Transcriptional regulator, MarR family n=1 Tax=Methanohalarchaeum thermophilum TaxID=1903181 RepID=A0A1Q6DTL8_METT1|nr:MAG: Transcriptional regulator, MarR family [Candidatus Methanohalarchaeum thermophilum]